MNLLCAICQDLLEPSNDIFITPCGHVFHFPCLIRWLEKVHNCPQCRQKVIKDKLIRIYFNFSNPEEIKEDSTTLQQKVDSLSFQIKLKETAYNTCNKENVNLKKQISGLRDEVKKAESEVKSKQAAIRALNEQTQYLLAKSEDYKRLKQEKDKLESQMGLYQNIKQLIISSDEQVTGMINGITDVSTLTTYVSVMKRELTVATSKRKELREAVKRLQQQLQAKDKQENSEIQNYKRQIEDLENSLAICQSENDMLKRQISKLKGEDVDAEEVSSVQNTSVNVPTRKRTSDFEFDIDFTIPKKLKKDSEKSKLFPSRQNSDDSDILIVTSPEKKVRENEENSPYLPTKSKSILLSKDRSSQHSSFLLSKRNILPHKKSSLVKTVKTLRLDDSVVFDGMGGHSKLDIFPTAKTSPSKLKRPINDSSKSKKLKIDLTSTRPIDNFVINLT